MRTLHGVLGLVAICATVVLLSIAGLASDFLTRLLSNVDGLLLLMICVLMGLLFAFMLYTLLKPARSQSSPTSGAANSAPPRPPGGTPAPSK